MPPLKPSNRRNWLKNAALLGASFASLPSIFEEAQANPAVSNSIYEGLLSEQNATEQADKAPVTTIRLNANENPLGPSAKAKQAIIDALAESYKYPMEALEEFKNAVAKKENVKTENILLGAGSSELLMASLVYYGSKGTILCADTCYISGNRNEKLPLEKVPLTKDYQYDLDAIKAKITDKTSLIYICNPNNPTGAFLDPAKLKAFIDEVSPKVPVLVDEAYIDYVNDPKTESMIESIRSNKNIIILRTFSKIHGFAGLRIGFALARPETVKGLMDYCTGGWNMSLPSLKAAVTSYADNDFQQFCVSKNKEAKAYLYDFLKKNDYTYVPSSANFVLFPLRMKGDVFLEKMAAEGVLVRRWEFDKQHWCRVSLGTMDQMKAFTAAFLKVTG